MTPARGGTAGRKRASGCAAEAEFPTGLDHARFNGFNERGLRSKKKKNTGCSVINMKSGPTWTQEESPCICFVQQRLNHL